MNTKQAAAIELVIFKPKPGLSTDVIKTSLMSLEPILKSYHGFISRELAVNSENQWMDLVFWESMEDAVFAAEDILMQEKAVKAFEVIDDKEMKFFHFKPVEQIS